MSANRCAALRVHHARRVEPDQADGAVVRQQFLHLRLGLARADTDRNPSYRPGRNPRCCPRRWVRASPAPANNRSRSGCGAALARRRQFLQRIAMERRGIDDVVLADLGVIHGEAVVMLAGDDDVLHAGVLGHLHPGIGVELHGIELLGAAVRIRVTGILAWFMIHSPIPGMALPFHSPAGMAVEPPMNEQAELRLAEPFHPLVLGRLLGRRAGRGDRQSGHR